MAEDRNALEVLVRVGSETEASLIVQYLIERGVTASAAGGFTAGFRAEAPGGVTVSVNRADLSQAQALLATLRQGKGGSPGELPQAITFKCPECGQKITFPGQRHGHVETCPECGGYVDVPERTDTSLQAEPQTAKPAVQPSAEATPPTSMASDGRTTAWLWIEVLAVLSLAYFPLLFSAVSSFVGGRSPVTASFVRSELFGIVLACQVSMPLLVIMALSKDPWSLFGIVRPRWLIDGLVGCLIWMCCIVVRQFVASVLPPSLLENATSHGASPTGPDGMAAQVILWIALIAGVFQEELVTRAYLIPRLERLLRSTFVAVLVTSVLFGSCHLYQGVLPAIQAGATGLVLGIAFCMTRRLWPLCVAHAIHNFIVSLAW